MANMILHIARVANSRVWSSYCTEYTVDSSSRGSIDGHGFITISSVPYKGLNQDKKICEKCMKRLEFVENMKCLETL